MKIVLSLLLVLIFWQGSAAQQLLAPLPVNTATGLITYAGVVPTPGVIQTSLLARAKVWANRVGVVNKPPLAVTELGTDILVVAGTQPMEQVNGSSPSALYFLVQVSLREGRYQYKFEELTLETYNTTGYPSYQTAESLFIQNPPPKATGNSYATRLRKAFDEAVAQAATKLHSALVTPLTIPNSNGTEW
ncbi:hypothetical protein QMK33_06645 [Hymenobacter sp. H14-R3]|uniref:hypothetical protein n=1 Tax=Hymenobacter sp. H14-R3 TaxID=3046308 RepID=UPI0024BAD094|nr:hypothetical protein [Hymenobacter sp. H14-R3]MDJ0364825.1 hypothetical protein [Hymenobacter sp. H14-R3]